MAPPPAPPADEAPRHDAGEAPTRGGHGRGIARDVAYATLGQLAYVLSQMAVLAALARLRGTEAVGEFGLAMAIVTPAFMFASMGVRTGQATDVGGRFAFAEYAGLVACTAALALAGSLAAGWALASGPEVFAIIAVVAAAKVFEAVSTLAYGAFQQAGRLDRMAASLLLRGMMGAALFAGLLMLGVPTAAAFAAQLVVWAAMALGLDYPRACRLAAGGWVRPSLEPRRLLALLRESAPIGAGYFLTALVISLPRLFVERHLGLQALGLFTAVGYVQQAAALVVHGVSQALVNRFARLRRSGDAAILRRVTLALLGITGGCTVVAVVTAWAFGGDILALLFGEGFRDAAALLVLVTFAVCLRFVSVVPQSLMHADRRFAAYFWYQAATLAACVALLSVLVPRMGLIGAGWTIVGVAVVRLALLAAATLGARRPAGGPRREPAPAPTPDAAAAAR